MVPIGIAVEARKPGAGALLLPRWPGRTRRATTEQLAGNVRGRGLEPHDRSRRHTRAVVLAHLHSLATRLRLGFARCRRALRHDAPLLVRSGRRWLPSGCRDRAGQGTWSPDAPQETEGVGDVRSAKHNPYSVFWPSAHDV